MNRLDFLMVREDVMEGIDALVDEHFEKYFPDNEDLRDELVGLLCDRVCEVMDPVGMD